MLPVADVRLTTEKRWRTPAWTPRSAEGSRYERRRRPSGMKRRDLPTPMISGPCWSLSSGRQRSARLTHWGRLAVSEESQAQSQPGLPPHRQGRPEGARRRPGHRARLFPAFARLRRPQDDVAIALTRLSQFAEPIYILRLEPYVKFAVRSATALEARARGVRRGYHGIGGGRDGESDQCNAATIAQTSIASPAKTVSATARRWPTCVG